MTERKMTGEELVQEAIWLFEGGVHPLMIAQMLNRKMSGMSKLCRTYNAIELAQAFNRAYTVAA